MVGVKETIRPVVLVRTPNYEKAAPEEGYRGGKEELYE
jgi:hypothetical protein